MFLNKFLEMQVVFKIHNYTEQNINKRRRLGRSENSRTPKREMEADRGKGGTRW